MRRTVRLRPARSTQHWETETFNGSIPQAMRQVITEASPAWLSDPIYVGCSGNFTIQRCLPLTAETHGNDVTLYSCLIGQYLAGTPIPIRVNDARESEWGWLSEHLLEPASAIATVMIATRMLQGLDNPGAYYARMRAGYREQFPRLLEETRAKVEAFPLRLASFFAGDVREFFDAAPKESTLVCFPPFWESGYERLFKNLEEVFDWQPPSYETFGDGDLEALLAQMKEHDRWFLGTHVRLDGEDEFYRGYTQTTARGFPILIYANHGPNRIVGPHVKTTPVLTSRLSQGEAIGDRLRIVPLKGDQFAALRSQYLNASIRPSEPTTCFGVMVDDRLIGAYGIDSNAPPGLFDPDSLYLMSDFAVGPSDEPRLSKLVLIAALSHESQRLLERMMDRRIRRLSTTAFTNNLTSMKYRGLFKQWSRRENEEPGAKKYIVNYTAPLGNWTLKEGMDLWLSKHR